MSAIRPITSSAHIPASFETPKDEFEVMNEQIEKAIETGDCTSFPDLFAKFDHYPEIVFHLYLAKDSCYPALIPALRRGEFQKVLNVLEALKKYPKLETPKIIICRAACLIQLGRGSECFAIRDRKEDFRSLIHQMTLFTEGYEKRCYLRLWIFIDGVD
jgi:hypothetical protein